MEIWEDELFPDFDHFFDQSQDCTDDADSSENSESDGLCCILNQNFGNFGFTSINVNSPPQIAGQSSFVMPTQAAEDSTFRIINQRISLNADQLSYNISCIKTESLCNPIYSAKDLTRKKKTNYRSGPETVKLKKNPHYNQSYESCNIYKILGNPSKKLLVEIGENYNIKFCREISSGEMKKFSRDQKRNMGLAVWFLEEVFSQSSIFRSWISSLSFTTI